MPGVYEFKLTVTDSAHHSDSDQVSVLVLTPEQSERELSLIMFFPTTPKLLPLPLNEAQGLNVVSLQMTL